MSRLNEKATHVTYRHRERPIVDSDGQVYGPIQHEQPSMAAFFEAAAASLEPDCSTCLGLRVIASVGPCPDCNLEGLL